MTDDEVKTAPILVPLPIREDGTVNWQEWLKQILAVERPKRYKSRPFK